MTPLNLAKALKIRVDDAVKDIELFDPDGKARVPQVIVGYLPNKQTVEDDDYPCIIIRVLSTEYSELGTIQESGIVQVAIAVFIYQESARDPNDPDVGEADKSHGWDRVMEMLTRISSNLLKNRLLAKQYNLYDLSWEIPPDQPEPQWGGYLLLSYDINVPQDEDGMEVLSGHNERERYDWTGIGGSREEITTSPACRLPAGQAGTGR
jgi:hypothetical protein